MQNLLEDLALQISDRAPIDWEQLEAEAACGDPTDPDVLANLKILALLAEFHSQDQSHTLEDWGPLRIIEKTDQGSFGEVFRAWDANLERPVALKLYDPVPESSRESREKLLREGRLLARVRHPNVVTVFGADEHDGRVGIWMEFIDGATLEQILHKHGPLDARQAAEIGIRLCKALTAVHRQGLVHRDVKAQNVMREPDGRIVLMDLGLGVEQKRERMHSIGGTPLYMAPELLRGRPAGAKSDIYALGVLLFHLVTGDFPVTGQSLQELQEAHRRNAPARLEEARPGLDQAFCNAVGLALESNPDPRPPSAKALEAQLRSTLDESSRPLFRRWIWLWVPLLILILGSLAYYSLLSPYLQRQTALRHLERAHQHYAAEQIDQAIHAARLAADADAEYASAHGFLSKYLQAVGQDKEALQSSLLAYQLRGSEDNVEGLQIKALYFSQRLLYDDAVDAYGAVIQLDSSRADVYRQSADLHFLMGEPGKAIEEAERAVEIEPASVINQGSLLLLKVQNGQPLQATLDELEDIRRKSGDDPTYLYWPQGLAYLVAGRSKEAKDAFDEMINSPDPEFATEGRFLKGQALIYEGEFQQAINVLRDGANLDAGKRFQRARISKRHMIASAYALRGISEAALQELEEFADLEAVPINLKSLRKAALLSLELGGLEFSRRIADKLEQIQRDYPSLISNGVSLQVQGEIALFQEDPVKARRLLDQSEQKWQDFWLAHSYSRLEIQQDQCAQAKYWLSEKIIAQPGRIFQDGVASSWVLAHLELAFCYEKLGEKQKAIESCHAYLDLWGDIGSLPRAVLLSGVDPDFCKQMVQ